MIGTRYSRALMLAMDWHGTQTRKGVTIPYMSHLMSVSALVMENGSNEDQAIAGLLHDAIEDAPTAEEADKREAVIKAEFGDVVARIVAGCTDGRPGKGGIKPPWKERKTAYLDTMAIKPADTMLVVACDKLHNLTCTVRDLRNEGAATLGRFNAGANELAWYYGKIGQVLTTCGNPVAGEYARLMDEFRGML